MENTNIIMAQNCKNSNELWNFIEKTYDEEQQITIEDFLAYYENELNGYGGHNDINLFNENRRNDQKNGGELETIAKIWFEFNKPKILEHMQRLKNKRLKISSSK